MPSRVHYAMLARHLSTLPLSATCAELAASVQAYLDARRNGRADLAAAIGELPPETEWLRGLGKLCEALQAENVRFDPGLFSEWCLEEK